MPESFIKTFETLAKFRTPFKNDVKTPDKIIIKPCPKENKNNIKIAKTIFLDNVANPIIPSKIGVEQGLDAKANKEPIKNGYKNRLLEFPLGNFLTIGTKFKSIIPTKFKPISKIKQARTIIK